MLIRNIFLSILLLLPGFSGAAESFTIKAVPVEDQAITLDGKLNEPVWKTAVQHGNFTIFRKPGKMPTESTSFRVAASRNGIYFAFDVIDKNILATVTAFDGPIYNEDAIELFITADDPVPDDPNVHNCRQLVFSPKGIRTDLAWMGGVNERKWTSDWRIAVAQKEHGYTAELFLPYYALNIVNAQTKRFHFNIARENVLKKGNELSVWSPTDRFINQRNFGTLELPFPDFSVYQWNVSSLELKNVPALDGTKQVLAGKISGHKDQTITLQTTVRRNQKLMAFNRAAIRVSGSTSFRIPLDVKESGKYEITLTGRIGTDKVMHQVHELNMEIVPFKLKLNHPVYRKSIFPDQKNKTLHVSIDYQTSDTKLLQGTSAEFVVSDANGKVMTSGKRNSGSVRTFTANVSKWHPGKYTISVKSTGHKALTGTMQDSFQIIAPAAAGNSVRIGNAREIYLNGKRFFPRGFMAGDNQNAVYFAEMSKARYNVIHFYTLNQMKPERIKFILDEALKHNLKVICYPYYRCKITPYGFRPPSKKKASPRLPEKVREEIKTWVKAVKDHPAFFAWYLCDEPHGAEFCNELRTVYGMLKEVDPHHPVIFLDMSAEGCVSKRDGYADLYILDMYPHPLSNGGWQRTVSSVLQSMKLVADGVTPHGVWFCPEAFKPKGSAYRSLTYREIRCLVFGSIVNGAMGILPYRIADPKTKYVQNTNNGIFASPDLLLGYMEGIGPEIKGLENVLLEPDRLPVKASNKQIILMRKKHIGKEFIIAVNTMPDDVTGTISAADLPDGTYRVLGENRTIKVKNGKLNDRFSGFMTHIYTNDATFPTPVDLSALGNKIRQEYESLRM